MATLTKSRMKHGTRSMYVHGCRCDDCALADREYKRERSARIKGKDPETWDQYIARMERDRQPHGLGGYRRGCVCEVCRDANRRMYAKWHQKQYADSLTETCETCDRAFTPHGLKCHNAAVHS